MNQKCHKDEQPALVDVDLSRGLDLFQQLEAERDAALARVEELMEAHEKLLTILHGYLVEASTGRLPLNQALEEIAEECGFSFDMPAATDPVTT